MGFWSDLFDDKKTYDKYELGKYFLYEILGRQNYEAHPDKLSTNFATVLRSCVKENCPGAHKWDLDERINYNVEKMNDTVYKLTYRGNLMLIKGQYGEILKTILYFKVIVYADKYADLKEYNGVRSTVQVFDKPPKD